MTPGRWPATAAETESFEPTNKSRSYRPKVRDRVTVQPIESDAYILNFQRQAVVVQAVDAGFMVMLDATLPPNRVFGPIPASRLLPGWRDENGRCRP